MICKVKPDYNQCHLCLESQIENDDIFDCKDCELNDIYYEIMYMTDDYVYLTGQEDPVRIQRDRIYDIKEVD